DGGSRGNPGHAAYGFVVKDDGKTTKEEGGYLGIATNNFAEYTAIVKALTWLKEHHPKKEIKFFLDSQLAQSQLSGLYKIKNAQIREMVITIKGLENEFKQISYTHIPREQNKEADRQVNLALDQEIYGI
ncbi:MAG TPA: ribonuclease HI family protein, partial [Candidatus Saccharimonadales bacterium]|nr:ribonuclease HI family protein [Candidatus Saccharimonadales bacterium]